MAFLGPPKESQNRALARPGFRAHGPMDSWAPGPFIWALGPWALYLGVSGPFIWSIGCLLVAYWGCGVVQCLWVVCLHTAAR